MKNLPQRERPARRARSTYSQSTPDRAPKVAYKYPSWVTERRDPPDWVQNELRAAQYIQRTKDAQRRFLRRKAA